MIEIQTSYKTLEATTLNIKKDSSKHFQKELDEKNDFDKNLDLVLKNLSDLEKEAYLNTLDEFKQNGLNEEELNLINTFNLYKFENKLEDLQLNEEQKELVESFNKSFNTYKEQLQEKREENYKLKKLQNEIFMNDTMLKYKDFSEGKESKDFDLKIEV